jgi:hypothetical protein
MEIFAANSVTPVTNAQNSDNSVVTSPKVSLYFRCRLPQAMALPHFRT